MLIFAISKFVNLDLSITSQTSTSLFFSIFCLIVFNVFILIIVEGLFDLLIGFHQKNNVLNLDKNPIKYLIQNRKKILSGVKLLFFLGLCLGFYGIWFAE